MNNRFDLGYLRNKYLTYFPEVKFHTLPRSLEFHAFDKSWFESEWETFWRLYKKALNFKYVPGTGACERFAIKAVDKMNDAVGKLYDPQGRDVSSGLFETRFMIPPGSEVNYVRDGGHSSCSVFIVEPIDIEVYFWEPQNEEWITIKEAAARGIRLCDVDD